MAYNLIKEHKMYYRNYPYNLYDRYPYRYRDRYYYDRYPYRDYYYNSQIGLINQQLFNYGYMRDVNQIANQYQYQYSRYY